MTSPARSKSWGYEVEVLALRALRTIFPMLTRTGASNQKSKGYPDLTTGRMFQSTGDTLKLIVTKDKGRANPTLVTMSMPDFLEIASRGVPERDVWVQVKGRKTSTLGSLYRELHAAVGEVYDAPLPEAGYRYHPMWKDRG